HEESTPEQLLKLYEITSEDLESIRAYGKIVTPRLNDYIDGFYSWMRTLPVFDEYFSDPQKLAQVQKLQLDYWREFLKANVDDGYVARRGAGRGRRPPAHGPPAADVFRGDDPVYEATTQEDVRGQPVR